MIALHDRILIPEDDVRVQWIRVSDGFLSYYRANDRSKNTVQMISTIGNKI